MTARITSSVLVGREAEFAVLRDAFKRARAGDPATVLVGGEAGIGKTRLVVEFGRHATGEGARILLGPCLELGEDGLPFAPFVAALRDLLRRHGVAAFAGHEQDFARLLPELGPAGPDLPGDTSRGYLFDLVGGLLDRLATERPLVLVLEDLHWADRSTRDLVGFLVRSVRAGRLLLVGTYRSDELHRGHPLRPFLAELDRMRGVVERLELNRLDREGTATIVANLAASPPSAPVVDSIHERSQGNPFFIEELVSCAGSAAQQLPDNLRDLLLAKVDGLAGPAQNVLRIAAAGGNKIGHRLLARVAGIPEVELEEAMRVAIAAQLIVIDADDGYEFRHALLREAVHDDSLPGEHSRLHAQYAAAIEAEPALVGVDRAPAELAHHWYAAHDQPRALTSAWRAAAVAGRLYAFAEKSRLLARVLELWDQVPDAAELIGLDRLGLLEEALAAAVDCGEHARAMSLTRAALGEVDRERDPLRAAQLLHQRGKLMRVMGKSDGRAELTEAYELAARVTEDRRRATLLADIAAAVAMVDRAAGRQLADEAAELARQIGDPALLASTSLMAGKAYGRLVSTEGGLERMRQAAEVAAATGDIAGLLRAKVNISDVLFELGRYDESAEAAASGVDDALRIGIGRTTGVFLLGNLAEALVALGRWDEAEARAAEAARLDPPGSSAMLWLEPQARIHLARGQPDAGRLVAQAADLLARPYLSPPVRLLVRGLQLTAALTAGDWPRAVTAAGEALDDPVLAEEPRYAWPLICQAARAAREAGDAALRARVEGLTGQVPARFPAETAHAALTAALVGAGEPTAWREAVTAWRATGQPYPLACALLSLAESAVGAGERAEAAEALDEAGEIAARLDAVPLRDAVAMLARRAGVRAGAATAVLLTPRELEVLRLVAEGQSNSRIAARLFISPKTASVHVSRIIAKLEVTNRGEAAAVARRLGLLDPATGTDPVPRT